MHIDDDAYKLAVRYAKNRKIGLGKAVSELVAKGARVKIPVKEVSGLLIFDPPKDFPKITTEQVRRIMEEEGI